MQELAAMYHSAAYDFLFRTDHWVLSDVESDPESYPLLWLDGVELHGADDSGANYHVVCLGRLTGIRREDGFEAGLRSAMEQGAMIILAHPHWMSNSMADVLRWPFDAVEVYNHVCQWINGKGSGLAHWDAALMHNPNTLGLAVDDAHMTPRHPGWNGGWIMVNAAGCAPAEITSGIRSGNFYSSCGPELQSIRFDGEQVHVETSPVKFVRLAGPRGNGERLGGLGDALMEKASFAIPDDWRYVYLEVEDAYGRRAWTNSLFVTNA